jgi:hypothetical protein
MWKALERYSLLDAEARSLFRRAAVLLPLTALSLRLRGFKRTREGLQISHSPNGFAVPKKKRAAEAVQMTCRMVRAATRYGIVRATCLEQSLVLWHLLQKQSIPVALRIGVRKSAEKFEAHAWVEYQGAALNQAESVHQHYAAFDSGFSDLPGEPS